MLAGGAIGLLLAENPWLDPRILALTGAMVVVMLVGAAIIAWADRYRKRLAEDRYSANQEMLSFRELYERGELTAEEYDRIRGRLRGRLKEELEVKERRPGAVPVVAPPPRPDGPPDAAPPAT
jgi:uncharacterized membrane protein